MILSDCLHEIAAELEAAGLYFGHGTDNAWDEAVALVLHVMELDAHSGEEVLRLPISEVQREAIDELVSRRIQERMPLPYLTNEAWFASLPFYVDERVLIPRSPFAEWIRRQFSPFVEKEQVQKILEIGTGSGCMSIVAALAFPEATVDAADIDVNALEVAAINVERYELAKRLTLHHSDVYASLSPKAYDIIMSNPPYVSHDEMQSLPAEYEQEPASALEASDEGLLIVEQILRGADAFLSEHGIVVIEVGNSEAALVARYPEVPFTWLEMEHGGHGVFVLTAQQVRQYFPRER